ncbi:unnamed protein product [Adineta steineri]|uniref:Uncharacterized protein n=1 Tax=Adineta steineri TaxID=433720 RepID=A0A818PTU8_9BILA|nr:unnamed protein product [Adineta steineri]CAF3630581.1 unnamed protein product [Adineta steineri]
MSDEATIEEEADAEHPSTTSRPETDTGLLKWSYIFEIVAKQWTVFLVLSIGIAVFLYMSRKKRTVRKDLSSAIKRDHAQRISQASAKPTFYKRE